VQDVVEELSWYLPEAHGEQEVAAVSRLAWEPGEHGAHALIPSSSAMVPAEQSLQEVAAS
jgi:hypothetical protein